MDVIFGGLAFCVLMLAQFFAVVAVHTSRSEGGPRELTYWRRCAASSASTLNDTAAKIRRGRVCEPRGAMKASEIVRGVAASH